MRVIYPRTSLGLDLRDAEIVLRCALSPQGWYANAVSDWSAMVGLQQTTQSLNADDVTHKRSDAGVAAGQKIATGEKNLSL